MGLISWAKKKQLSRSLDRQSEYTAVGWQADIHASTKRYKYCTCTCTSIEWFCSDGHPIQDPQITSDNAIMRNHLSYWFMRYDVCYYEVVEFLDVFHAVESYAKIHLSMLLHVHQQYCSKLALALTP